MRQQFDDMDGGLQGLVNDLIGVQTLAGAWSGCEPRRIAATLLDMLVRLLDLDFAYARVGDSKDSAPLEIIRLARRVSSDVPPQEVGRALGDWLPGDASESVLVVPNPVAEGRVSISILQFGLKDRIGTLVAGSRRSDFPAMTERLLLQVAANQATAALQEIRVLEAQKRAAEELERCVARTAQLAAANDEMRREIAERRQAEAETSVIRYELAAELAAMTRLHELSTRLLSQNDFHAVLEEVLDATIALLNADFGNVQLYNPETRALEIVAQRGFKQDFLDYFNSAHEDFCDAALQRRHRVIVEDVLTDPVFRRHLLALTAAGYRALQSTPLFNRSGEPLGVISTHFRRPHRPSEHELRLTDLYARQAVELIERTRAEKKLAESERRFRLLADSIPHHVWCYRSDGTGDYWNRRLIDYTGFTEEELRSGGWAVHHDDVAGVKAGWEKAWARGTAYEGEQRVRGRDDRYRRFICRAVAVRDGQGRPIEWFGTNTDIEERRQAEEALHKARTELAHVTRVTAMGELAASIAHEVNQPLAAVVANGYACTRWLSVDPPNVHEASQSAQRIVRDANRASHVVFRIRAFLKRGESQPTALDIAEVVREVIGMAEGEIRSHDVHFSSTASTDLPPVLGDRIQLQQVMLNLLMNAVEAMDTVTERLRTLSVEIARYGGETVRVAVCDSGTGLDPAYREQVFDAFHTTKPHGMGMGLAVSRSIIEAHGGRLWATPNDGPGETFQFTVPLAAPATP